MLGGQTLLSSVYTNENPIKGGAGSGESVTAMHMWREERKGMERADFLVHMNFKGQYRLCPMLRRQGARSAPEIALERII